jgi:ubiquinone/menaquinone biosynthesis C-methylase UbiE
MLQTTITEDVLAYLQKVPPTIIHTCCELCGGGWLMTIANQDRYGLPVRFVMCRQCGLITLNPRWGQEPYNKFYTDYYRPLVAEWSGEDTSMAHSVQMWFQKMAQATALAHYLPASPRVVDIGGGDGFLAEYLRDQYGAEVVIVEPNAREAQEAVDKGFEVIVDVFENCHLDPASYDLVVMLRTVDHLIHASETLAKVRHILRPQGVMLVDGVDYYRRMALCGDATKPLKIDHCYYFSPETLPMLMRKSGLLPIISDVVAIPGQVVVLAQAGAPMDISNDGFERFLGADYRYYEWERLVNRPSFVPRPGHFTRALQTELTWLKNQIRRRWARQP